MVTTSMPSVLLFRCGACVQPHFTLSLTLCALSLTLCAAIANMEMVNYLGYSPNYYDYRSEKIQCPACYSYNYTAWAGWLLKEEVTEALGVCGDAGEWRWF